jgi:hypothetical protein
MSNLNPYQLLIKHAHPFKYQQHNHAKEYVDNDSLKTWKKL